MGLLATSETGGGPPVLLLHGLNGFKEGWGSLPEALARAGLRAVDVDLPGVGGTPPLRRAPHSPRALAETLAPLVSRLQPVALVGHSFGGPLALLVAVRHPDVIRRMALIAPFTTPRPGRFPPRGISDLLHVPVAGPPLARLAIAWIRRSPERRRQAFLGAVAHPERLRERPDMERLVEEASDRIATADLGAMVEWAASGTSADLRPLAPRVGQPTLVVAGALDRVTGSSGAAALVAALPAGRLVRVDDVAHFPHLEAPGRVVPAVVAHLAGE